MNLVDDVEIELFEITGDPDIAEAAGTALRLTFEALAAIMGFPPELFTDPRFDICAPD